MSLAKLANDFNERKQIPVEPPEKLHFNEADFTERHKKIIDNTDELDSLGETYFTANNERNKVEKEYKTSTLPGLASAALVGLPVAQMSHSHKILKGLGSGVGTGLGVDYILNHKKRTEYPSAKASSAEKYERALANLNESYERHGITKNDYDNFYNELRNNKETLTKEMEYLDDQQDHWSEEDERRIWETFDKLENIENRFGQYGYLQP